MGDRCKADIIVALYVVKPHPINKLVAALMGLVVVTPEFCKIGGSKGAILKYNRAMKAEKVPFGSRMQPICNTQMLLTPLPGVWSSHKALAPVEQIMACWGKVRT